MRPRRSAATGGVVFTPSFARPQLQDRTIYLHPVLQAGGSALAYAGNCLLFDWV
jgi:hypothetical protein